VIRLTFADIDWRAGKLLVRGKGGRVDRLPLTEDVGGSIASYLQRRPKLGSSDRVFIHAKAPYTGFASPPNGICCIVRRALKRANLDPPHKGAHLLRHSLATRMLGGGASLFQVSQVLRHKHPQTTEIYAKVHLEALRKLAQPWPGGEP
jgi:site-specific recombinase XerD